MCISHHASYVNFDVFRVFSLIQIEVGVSFFYQRTMNFMNLTKTTFLGVSEVCVTIFYRESKNTEASRERFA